MKVWGRQGGQTGAGYKGVLGYKSGDVIGVRLEWGYKGVLGDTSGDIMGVRLEWGYKVVLGNKSGDIMGSDWSGICEGMQFDKMGGRLNGRRVDEQKIGMEWKWVGDSKGWVVEREVTG